MLGYFKRVGEDSQRTARGDPAKRPRSQHEAKDGMASKGGCGAAASASKSTLGIATSSTSPGGCGGGGDPKTIVIWNANGLGVRLSKDWHDFKEFMVSVMPDVCCIQEVRFAAAGFPNCKKDENRGRKRGQLKADTVADRKDRDLLQSTLKPLAERLGYRLVMSLANYKYAGTAALIRNTCPASGIYYSLTPEGLSKEHHPEGRVIALEFASFTLVIFYVPNNGVKEESFRRREEWDANVRAFAEGYDRPLVISGDLNVAHGDADLTHPAFFKRMCPAPDARNSGQPGCTPAEQERHSQLLECGGGLVDAYRLLHPVSSEGEVTGTGIGGNGKENEGGGGGGGVGGGTDTEGITWRGTAGNSYAEMGRFYGKGMRIDYFLVSKPLAPLVAEVNVFGSGADRRGFLGSDHSPVLLRFRDTQPQQEAAKQIKSENDTADTETRTETETEHNNKAAVVVVVEAGMGNDSSGSGTVRDDGDGSGDADGDGEEGRVKAISEKAETVGEVKR